MTDEEMYEEMLRELKKDDLWMTPTCTQTTPRSKEGWAKKAKHRKDIGRSTMRPGNLEEQVLLMEEQNGKTKERIPDTESDGLKTRNKQTPRSRKQTLEKQSGRGGHVERISNINWWEDEALSRIHRVVDGIPNRVDRIKGCGNGQVPRVVEVAWKILSRGL